MRMTRSKSGLWSIPGDRWQSEKGQALVEAAFVLPLLLLMIFVIFDFSLLFYAYQSMEYGISEATRYGITGQQRANPSGPGNLTRDESVKLIMRESNPLITLADSSFTFEHLSGATWTAGSGGSGEIARVTVNYNWRPITPLIGGLFTGGQIPLRVSSTMLNEGF